MTIFVNLIDVILLGLVLLALAALLGLTVWCAISEWINAIRRRRGDL